MTAEANRLRWQCRRGYLELDLCLQRFLDRGFAELGPDSRAVFAGLLRLGDDTLMAWLVQGGFPPPEYREIVAKIRAA